MKEIYLEFFPKKIYDNLIFLEGVFNNMSKDWEGELNKRFLKAEDLGTLESFFG